MGDEMTHIIESPQLVKIQFGGLKNPNADAETDINALRFNGPIVVRIKYKPNPKYLGQRIRLIMELVHEFSHVHNFIKFPHWFSIDSLSNSNRVARFVLELNAFDRVARFAIEMDPSHGKNPTTRGYTNRSRFTGPELANYGSASYNRKLHRLAATTSGYPLLLQ